MYKYFTFLILNCAGVLDGGGTEGYDTVHHVCLIEITKTFKPTGTHMTGISSVIEPLGIEIKR